MDLKKMDPSTGSEKHTIAKQHLKVKGWDQILQENKYKKQARIAILISDKLDFKPKLRIGNREGHYIFIKVKIYQEYAAILASIYQAKEYSSS